MCLKYKTKYKWKITVRCEQVSTPESSINISGEGQPHVSAQYWADIVNKAGQDIPTVRRLMLGRY